MSYLRKDVLAGGSFGYTETMRPEPSPTHIDWTYAYDDAHLDPNGTDNPMRVTGISFAPNGTAYFSHGDPKQLCDRDPHDIVYLSNNPNTNKPGVAVLIARLDNTLELWTYDLGHNLIHQYTGLQVDSTWIRDVSGNAPIGQIQPYAKLDVLCDSKTIYYTTRGRTIFRYDITGSGTQLTNFAQLYLGAHHVYAALRIVKPQNYVLVAMTTTGNGPRNGLALEQDTVWTDEINPPDGYYDLFERSILTGTDILDNANAAVTYRVRLDPTNTNAEVYSLDAWYNGCPVRRIAQVTLIGAT